VLFEIRLRWWRNMARNVNPAFSKLSDSSPEINIKTEYEDISK
jgi:hypothetical protein